MDFNPETYPKGTTLFRWLIAKSLSLAEKQKQSLVSTCSILEVPLKPSKLVGPGTCLTFLGIETDTFRSHSLLFHSLLGTTRHLTQHNQNLLVRSSTDPDCRRFNDPHTEHMPWLRQVLNGIKVEAGKAGKQARSNHPFNPEEKTV